MSMAYPRRGSLEDASPAGESSVETLMQRAVDLMGDFETKLEPSLSQIAIQLMDHGMDTQVPSEVKSHVYAWNSLVRAMQRVTLRIRENTTTVQVQSRSFEDEIDKHKEVIRALERDLQRSKEDYESQIATLHDLLADSSSHSPTKDGSAKDSSGLLSQREADALRAQMEVQFQQFQRMQGENEKLQEKIRYYKRQQQPDEQEAELSRLSELLDKREEELLAMRITMHDLEKERIENHEEIAELKSRGQSTRDAVRDADYSMGADLDRFFSPAETEAMDTGGSGTISDDDEGVPPEIAAKVEAALKLAAQFEADGGVVAAAKAGSADAYNDELTPPPHGDSRLSPSPPVRHGGGGHGRMPRSALLDDLKNDDYGDDMSAFEDLAEFLSLPIPRDKNALRSQLEYAKRAMDDMRSEIEDYQLRLKAAEDGFDPARDVLGANTDSEEDNPDDELIRDYAERALGKKTSKHDRFFSTFTQFAGLGGAVEDAMAIQQQAQADKLVNFNQHEKTYKLVMDSLRMKLKNGQTECSIMADLVHTVVEDLDTVDPDTFDNVVELSEFVDLQKQSIAHLSKSAKKLSEVVEQVIDELKGAEVFVHPDQKRISQLDLRIKELRDTISYVSPRQFAVLKRVPRFIKDELERYEERCLREKALSDAIAGLSDPTAIAEVKARMGFDAEFEREERERRRIHSFNTVLYKLEASSQSMVSNIDTAVDTLLSVIEDAVSSDEPSSSAVSQKMLKATTKRLRNTMEELQKFALDICNEYSECREFVHPTHEALIQATMDNVDKSIEIESLKREVGSLKGSLKAAKEQLTGKRKEGILKDRIGGSSEVTSSGAPKASSSGSRSSRSRREPSWGLGSFDITGTNFLDVAEFELKDNSDFGIEDDEHSQRQADEAEKASLEKAQDFLPSLQTKIDSTMDRCQAISTIMDDSGLSSGTASSRSSDLKQLARDISNELLRVNDVCQEMMESVRDADGLFGADSRYVARMEARYQQYRALYRMKAVETSNMKDNLIHSEEQLSELREKERELRLKVQQLMTSAAAPQQWRMEALQEQGLPSQSWDRVMKFITECVSKTDRLCGNIDGYTQKDLPKLVHDSLDGEERRQLFDLKTQVQRNTEAIRNILADVSQEMIGASSMVHGDRDYIRQLEAEVLHLKQFREGAGIGGSPEQGGPDDREISPLDGSIEEDNQKIDHEMLRAKYQAIVEGLCKESESAQKQCSLISNILRTAFSEVSRSRDRSEWIQIMGNVTQSTNEHLALIHETLSDMTQEVTSAGLLLANNDERIVAYEERMSRLLSAMTEARNRHFAAMQATQQEIITRKGQLSEVKQELSEHKFAAETTQTENNRLQQMVDNLSRRLDAKYHEKYATKVRSGKMSELEKMRDDLGDEQQKQVLSQALVDFESLINSEKQWRFKCNEMSRQLDEANGLKELEKRHWSMKEERLIASFEEEKRGLMLEHSKIVEGLNEELVLKEMSHVLFDLETQVKQLEESLLEAHLQLTDKDEETRELQTSLEECQFEIGELKRENSSLKVSGPMPSSISVGTSGGGGSLSAANVTTPLESDATPISTAAGDDASSLHSTVSTALFGARQLQKCNEITGILQDDLESLQKSVRQVDSYHSQTAAVDVTDDLVLLSELVREMSVLASVLSERDEAIRRLNDKLLVNEQSSEILMQKYTRVLKKYGEIDDDYEAFAGLYGADDDAKVAEDELEPLSVDKLGGEASDKRRTNSIHKFEKVYQEAEEAAMGETAVDPMTRVTRSRKRDSKRRRSSLNGIDVGEFTDAADLRVSGIRSDMRETKSDLDPRAKEDAIVDSSKLFISPKQRRGGYGTGSQPPSPTKDDDDHADAWREVIEEEVLVGGPGDKREVSPDLSKMVADRDMLIQDLTQHIEALKESRSGEIKSIQSGLELMRNRCASWFENLVLRLDELEDNYRRKLEERALDSDNEKPGEAELMEELARVRDELKMYRSSFDDSQNRLEATEKENQRLREDLDEAEQDLERAKDKERSLRDVVSDYEERLKRAEQSQAASALTGGATGMDGANTMELEADLERAEQEVAQMKEALRTQEEEYETEVKQFEEVANEKLQQLEVYYMKRIDEMQEQLNRSYLEEDMRSLESQLAEKSRKLELTEEQMREQTEKFVQAQKIAESLQSKLKMANDMVMGERSKTASYKKGIEDLGNQLKSVLQEQDSMRKELERTEKKLSKKKEKSKKLREKLKKSEQQVDNLKGITKEMVELKRSWKQSAQEWQTKEGQFSKQIDELKHEIGNLQDQKLAQIRRTVQEINDLREYIKKLQIKIRVLEERARHDDAADSVAASSTIVGGVMNFVGLGGTHTGFGLM